MSPSSDREYWKKLEIVVRSQIRTSIIENASSTKTSEILPEATTVNKSPRAFARDVVLNATDAAKKQLKTMMVLEEELDQELLPLPPKTPKTPKTHGVITLSSATPLAELRTAVTIRDAPKVELLVRVKAKIDPHQMKLHLELDFVPGIKTFTKLSDLVLSVFGRTIAGRDAGHHLAAIRRMLTGLEVSRVCQVKREILPHVVDAEPLQVSEMIPGDFPTKSPESKNRRGKRPAEISTDRKAAEATGVEVGPPDFIIRDVQMAHDVPKFLKKDKEGDNKYISVPSHFKQSKQKIRLSAQCSS